MEKKIEIWDELNAVEQKEIPEYVLADISMIFEQYESKRYELKDGWIFKLASPYFLTEHDEKLVTKHCQKRDKFNYILMKYVDGTKERLQRPRIQKVAHSRL